MTSSAVYTNSQPALAVCVYQMSKTIYTVRVAIAGGVAAALSAGPSTAN